MKDNEETRARFFLLDGFDEIIPGDDFLATDMRTWHPVADSEQWLIGKRWHNGLVPMRRRQLLPEPANPEARI
jgi:hypothetical protein